MPFNNSQNTPYFRMSPLDQTAFGEFEVAELTPSVQLTFPLVAEEIFLNPGEQVTFSGVAIATASVDMATGVTFIEQF